MLQTLFSIPKQIAGLSVFGLGLLLAVWVLISVGIVVWLVRRQGFNAETKGYLPVLILVAAAIVLILPGLVEEAEGGLPIRGYGVMMMLGVMAGIGLAANRSRRAGFDPDLVFSLSFWMFVAGIVGARLFHVIEYWSVSYYQTTDGRFDLIATLKQIANIPAGGLVVYGSLIATGVIVPWFMWRNKLRGLAMMDLMAPSMVLGLALGRVGCLLNGCCFGGVCELPWAITFPHYGSAQNVSPPYNQQLKNGLTFGFLVGSDENGAATVSTIAPRSEASSQGLKPGMKILAVGDHRDPTADDVRRAIARADRHYRGSDSTGEILKITVEGDSLPKQLLWQPPPESSLPVHPAQLYSAINAGLLCLLLLAVHPHRRRDGVVFALMLTIYPVTRFLLEIIRTDEADMFGTELSISQLVSLVLISGVALLWWHILRQPKDQLWANQSEK